MCHLVILIMMGTDGHLKVSGTVSTAEQEGDVSDHGPRHTADTAHTPGRVLLQYHRDNMITCDDL